MALNDSKMSPIPVFNFYRNANEIREKVENIEKRNKNFHYMHIDINKLKMPQRLFGPPQDWVEFFKQVEAIEFADKNKSKNFSVFVYQNSEGFRRFTVAHPEVYWWNFKKLAPERRCAYEVIVEGLPCCIYVDLEYQKNLNPKHNGIRMTKTLIELICSYVLKFWGIPGNSTNVINLDSSNSIKFSRHLIFRWKQIAFKDNIHVGRFIKSICNDIEKFIETNDTFYHNVLSYFKRKDLEQLFINTDKGKKLFIDNAVYTKNRHFRIFQATKWGKFSHLERAKECKYTLLTDNHDKELGLFLESLISYFPVKSDLMLLEVDDDMGTNVQKYSKNQCSLTRTSGYKPSPYPAIDKFIESIVKPGSIRTSKYFSDMHKIIYEIDKNYRFCKNIGRFHKSNHIYFVVDIPRIIIYQKCHDPDCGDFKSESIPIPPEVYFHLDDGNDDLFFEISDTIIDTALSKRN